jgi:hypothetical protein
MFRLLAFICAFLYANSTHCKPKVCVNCKYFISDGKDNLFGKCSFFPIAKKNNNFLVTGEGELEKLEYNYCSIVRTQEAMCGSYGRFHTRIYNKKIKKT